MKEPPRAPSERAVEDSMPVHLSIRPAALFPPALDAALRQVASEETPFEDRAALFAALHQLQLRVNRVIRRVKPDLAYRMFTDKIAQAGPLRLKHVARKVLWRANEESAWTDAVVQQTLEELRHRPEMRPFVTHIPDHYEVNAQALAAAMAGKLPPDAIPAEVTVEELQEVARQFYRECKDRRWRVELESEETIEVVE